MTAVLSGTSEVEAAGRRGEPSGGQHGRLHHHLRHAIHGPGAPHQPPRGGVPQGSPDHPGRRSGPSPWPSSGRAARPIYHFPAFVQALFSTLLTPEREVKAPTITVDGLPSGTYYWRVRSAGSDAKAFWSSIYRFRILQVFQRPRIQRELKLTVVATPIGDGVIIQGTTDPGVSVSVNDLEIPVNADGTFSKIVLFSDVGTQAVQVRAFDDEGNEKIWRKSFQSVGY